MGDVLRRTGDQAVYGLLAAARTPMSVALIADYTYSAFLADDVEAGVRRVLSRLRDRGLVANAGGSWWVVASQHPEPS